MDIARIYLKGEYYHGLYGAGTIVYARRDDELAVVKGEYYTIKEIIVTELGSCARNQGIVLEEVEGVYFKNTFRVDEECHRRQMIKNDLSQKL